MLCMEHIVNCPFRRDGPIRPRKRLTNDTPRERMPRRRRLTIVTAVKSRRRHFPSADAPRVRDPRSAPSIGCQRDVDRHLFRWSAETGPIQTRLAESVAAAMPESRRCVIAGMDRFADSLGGFEKCPLGNEVTLAIATAAAAADGFRRSVP